MGNKGQGADQTNADEPAIPRHVAMSWAQRLKRVFGVEIERCAGCGGKFRIIASIEEPEVIAKILAQRPVSTALDDLGLEHVHLHSGLG